jgi:hypothetical protein
VAISLPVAILVSLFVLLLRSGYNLLTRLLLPTLLADNVVALLALSPASRRALSRRTVKRLLRWLAGCSGEVEVLVLDYSGFLSFQLAGLGDLGGVLFRLGIVPAEILLFLRLSGYNDDALSANLLRLTFTSSTYPARAADVSSLPPRYCACGRNT